MVIRVPDQRKVQGAYERLDDRMLVLDFQAGHPEAYVEIHNRYSPLARRVCLRFLRNQQDADEALQETMIRVFQGLHRFNGRYALSPWVARIAKNVSLDTIRRQGRRPLEEDEGTDAPELKDDGDSPEAAYERLVERDLVLSVLEEMPVPHRDALVLRELEGRSHREIAHEMDISTSQAKALIHRAKASFRRRWLVAVTEKGRLTAIAVLPLLWAAKVLDLGKRVVERVGHATHITQAASAPEIVAAASASSAAPVAAVGISERVVAAGMTILLAGGVTVGAAKIVEHRSDGTREAAVAAAPVVEDLVEEPEAAAPAEPEVDADAEVVADLPEIPEERLPIVDTPSPTTEPDTGTEPSPSTDPPSEEPSTSEEPPVPSEEPPVPSEDPPVLPPPPAWEGSFRIDWASEDKCGCGSGLELVSSSSTGGLLGPDAHMSLDQTLKGAALDGEGDAAWEAKADLRFDLRREGGSVELDFWLTTRSGIIVTFGGDATVAAIVGDLDAGEPVLYSFRGEYYGIGAETAVSPIRVSGPLSVDLWVWADGSTVVLTDVSLLP